MLTVHHSNRVEALAESLAQRLRAPGDPLAPRTVVVQSAGLARWLALALADRLGVCANVRFPFPAAFVWEVFRAVLPDVPERAPFAPEVLAWRVMGALARVPREARFAPVRAYLAGGDELRRLELAQRIAATFDQYLVYRPDWIRAWERGEGEHWQAALWRTLAAGDAAGRHWVALRDRLCAALERCERRPAGLPAEIALFGIPALSPGYLDILGRVARLVDVHLFQLNPCREYWGDIVPERERARRARGPDAAPAYLEVGNGLLASLGRQGRDFIDLLQEGEVEEREAFAAPAPATLLEHMQADILELRDRGAADCAPIALAAGDRSVEVHVCHGPMRELEVLHDRLLDLFERAPDLVPADVVVMTPDIAAYAPYVEAVFGAAEGARRIPYTLADRGVRAESPVVETFFALLALPEQRFDANQVLAPLEAAAVQRRFGLTEQDLPRLRRWVRETGIRWGVDGAARAALALPADDAHTWRAGLDRLLLGLALPGGGTAPFAGILPYDDVEGQEAALLGRFAAYGEALFDLREALSAPRSPSKWALTFMGLAGRFLDPAGEDEAAVQALRLAIEALGERAAAAGFTAPIGLPVAAAAVQGALAGAPGGGFLSGAVTFCALVPMRSIPFEVVCLIGMNDGAFPRQDRPADFDLMAVAPRRGDRSRRADDRYLFLETLLSARRVLYLSYVGQDIRDNAPLPPSVLVDELLDHVRRGFRAAGGGDPVAERTVHHPLQPFSPRYFGAEPDLFSYAAELCEAQRGAGTAAGPAPLVEGRLPEAQAEWRAVDLDALAAFLANPARYLLQRRLGVYLEAGEGLLEDHEPFALGALARLDLRARLLALEAEGADAEAQAAVVAAAGLLPHGAVGEAVLGTEQALTRRFGARLAAALPPSPLEPVGVDLDLGTLRLTGWIKGLGPDGQLGYRPGRRQMRDTLGLWVRHLALNCVAPPGVEPASAWLGDDEVLRLAPLDDAPTILAALAALFWEGLHRPLPFFPRSAWAYATAGARSDPLAAARRVWESEYAGFPEGADPYYRLAFRDRDPLGDEFVALAAAVLDPLLACREAG